LAAGLIVAALALITVGIAAAVATSGGSAAPQLTNEEPKVAALPVTMPLPVPAVTTGYLDVRGPLGAQVQVGRNTYHQAPVRIELPTGDYVVQLRWRVGKRLRVVHHSTHVTAGQTEIIR
jgi:hypothetical protein